MATKRESYRSKNLNNANLDSNLNFIDVQYFRCKTYGHDKSNHVEKEETQGNIQTVEAKNDIALVISKNKNISSTICYLELACVTHVCTARKLF